MIVDVKGKGKDVAERVTRSDTSSDSKSCAFQTVSKCADLSCSLYIVGDEPEPVIGKGKGKSRAKPKSTRIARPDSKSCAFRTVSKCAES